MATRTRRAFCPQAPDRGGASQGAAKDVGKFHGRKFEAAYKFRCTFFVRSDHNGTITVPEIVKLFESNQKKKHAISVMRNALASRHDTPHMPAVCLCVPHLTLYGTTVCVQATALFFLLMSILANLGTAWWVPPVLSFPSSRPDCSSCPLPLTIASLVPATAGRAFGLLPAAAGRGLSRPL